MFANGFYFIALLSAFSAQAQNIRVLFLGGGSTTPHDPLAMSQVMIPVMQRNGMTVDYRTNESVLNVDSLSRYQVMFIYNNKKGSAADGTPDLTTAQENALYGWVDAGHVIVGVHSANSSYLGNPRYLQLFGAAFTIHGDTAAYRYITIVNPGHPAMLGVSAPPATGNAAYWDEGREAQFSKNDTIMLARARANGTQEPWTWVRPEGNGWVYYTSSGHDARVWNDVNYQGQLIRALLWGAGVATPIFVDHQKRKTDAFDDLIRGDIRSLRITNTKGETVFFRNHPRVGESGFPRLGAGTYFLSISRTDGPVYKSLIVK